MFKIFVAIMIGLNTNIATSNSLRRVVKNMNKKYTTIVVEMRETDGR